MFSTKIFACTEVVEEIHQIQWRVKNFMKILQDNSVETLKLCVITGESSKFESKWVFGFIKRNSKWYEKPFYLKVDQLPEHMDKIAVKLCVQSLPKNQKEKEYQCKASQDAKNIVLKLNEPIKCKIVWNSDQVQGLVDEEGTLTLDLTLTVFMPRTY